MSLNLGEVFITFEKKYDRKNVLTYILLLFVFCLLSLCISTKTLTTAILFLTIYIIESMIYIGYFVVTSNNEANNIENAFPPITEFKKIICEGIKYTFGTSLLCFVIYLIPFILLIVSILLFSNSDKSEPNVINLILSIIVFVALTFLIAYFVFWPLNIIYLKSLKFSDLFAFNKIKSFKKEKGSQFLKFILFSILVYIAIYASSSAFSIITNTAGKLSKIDNIEFYSQILTIFITMSMYPLLMPNLIGQIAKYDVANDEELEDYELYDDEEDDDEDNEEDV